jgi:chromosome segregation ATPase
MNKKIQVALTASVFLLTALPVFAQNVITPPPTLTVGVHANASAAGTNANVKLQTRITTAKSHADQELNRRINALTSLNTRVQATAKVSATVKATMANQLNTQISNLAALKTKIDADTDIATLKTDIKSITDAYRIFMLVIPQARIAVASDSLQTTSSSMFTLATKIKARVDAAVAAGADGTSMNASVDDLYAKIGDANIQSDAAVSEVASLTPDQGDKTKMAANDQAIKDARAKLKVAMQELQAARKDISSILGSLKSLKANASTSATVQ